MSGICNMPLSCITAIFQNINYKFKSFRLSNSLRISKAPQNLTQRTSNLKSFVPMVRSKISDSPSSSSTSATDEKEKARQIITQLNNKSVNPSLFIRYASFPGQNSLGFASNDPFALGPIFVDHCPQELVDIFPYSENIQPLYQHRNAKWGPFSTKIKFEPWPLPKSDWFTWVERMYIGLKDK
jgi:hypothetical protein